MCDVLENVLSLAFNSEEIDHGVHGCRSFVLFFSIIAFSVACRLAVLVVENQADFWGIVKRTKAC